MLVNTAGNASQYITSLPTTIASKYLPLHGPTLRTWAICDLRQ